jgi:hydroxyacylglutathione hydrolase
MVMLEIVAVPAFSDNYIWLVHDPDSGQTAVVDPGDAAPTLAAAGERGWTIGQVWNTHWHPDHTGGNGAVKATSGAVVSGPAGERITVRDRVIADADTVRIGRHEGRVLAVPGHTLDHLALVFDEAQLAFVGDTIFAMGCGRLFEGSAEQMFGSLQRLAALPEQFRLYPAHEYTLSNARFAAHAEPNNQAVAQRLRSVEELRREGRITLPTTVGEERATNPFVRADSVETFARLRAAKDSFA